MRNPVRFRPRHSSRALVACAVVSLLAVAACARTTSAPRSVEPANTRDYAVYDAVLSELVGDSATGGARRRYVIEDSTRRYPEVDSHEAAPSAESVFGPVLSPLVSDLQTMLLARNASSTSLDASLFHPNGQVELVSKRALAALTKDATDPAAYWRAFYARYPDTPGLISFSRPGYDSSGTHALLAYGHRCGGRCGDRGYVLLEWRSAKWSVVRRVVTSQS